MSTIDTLYQAWLSNAKEFMPNSEHTFDMYIDECFACLQDPDDITDDVIYVTNYVTQQDQDNPGWRDAYA